MGYRNVSVRLRAGVASSQSSFYPRNHTRCQGCGSAAMVTIKDVAREVGLSVTTVSRALGNHDDVAAETKARIRAVADRLDYHPNAAARSLQNRRSNTIGLVIPPAFHRAYDPSWLEFIGGMAVTCARRGVDL